LARTLEGLVVVPWALCPLTCGVVVTCGAAGAGAEGDSLVALGVCAAGALGVVASGAGVGAVVVCAGGVVVSPLVVGAASSAGDAAGTSRTSAAIAASRRPVNVAGRVIRVQLPRR
jgi:hypothetical protein